MDSACIGVLKGGREKSSQQNERGGIVTAAFESYVTCSGKSYHLGDSYIPDNGQCK